MLTLLAALLACAGLCAYAMTMERHQDQWLRRSPGRATRIGLRVGGSLLLLLSLAVCIRVEHGFILWLGLLTPASLTTAILLVRRPNRQ